ncbi:hypothetical protein B0H14DRAFT_1116151 [Mycena olivaceomarginata]|nr:hypothetical protein B0H14DRAFT_1116151 [Mycena olivaceomarginata]
MFCILAMLTLLATCCRSSSIMGPSLPMPTTACLRTILRGIPFGAGNQRMRLLASNIICSATHWFRDNELRPILREHSVWAALGELLYAQSRALLHLQSIPDELASFIDLGDNLSQTVDWKVTMSDDLTVWLSHLPYLHDLPKRSEDQFCSVLSRVWNVEGQQFGDEKPLAMAFTALAAVWSQSVLSNPREFRRLLALIECTISTAFCARRNKRRLTTFNPSRRFKDIVMVRLGDALALAAQRLRAANAATANNVQDLDQELPKKFVENTADLLSRLASTVQRQVEEKNAR